MSKDRAADEHSRAMTVHVVRHATAREQQAWDRGDDDARPLTATGRRQAEALIPVLSSAAVELVSSSPSLRCVQTVEPLARARGLTVHADTALAEGNGARAVALVMALVRVEAVLCSHGDVIPQVLDAMADEGVAIHPRRWEKASVWTLHTAGGRFTRATYMPA